MSRRLPLRHAVALGAIQGPAELLPVSSSGHLVLVPALLGWPYTRLPPDTRKTFEVALHAGTAAALLVLWRRELAEDLTRPAETALLAAPAAAAGVAFERVVEERLSTPVAAALAQAAAGVLLALSQRRLGRGGAAGGGGGAAGGGGGAAGGAEGARVPPALLAAVGVAQAAALVPGVSRSGAALTTAALAGLDRGAAAHLSRRAALPVVAGAAALKGLRLACGGLSPQLRAPFAAGAVAAFASTLAAKPLGALPGRHSWTPWAVWRVAAGAAALRRLQALQ